MTVSRTIELTDITPTELATMFTDMDSEKQAWFFACIWRIAKDWPGAGWCQQSCEIIRSGSVDTISAIETLASHLPAEALERLAKVAAE